MLTTYITLLLTFDNHSPSSGGTPNLPTFRFFFNPLCLPKEGEATTLLLGKFHLKAAEFRESLPAEAAGTLKPRCFFVRKDPLWDLRFSWLVERICLMNIHL